MSTETQLDGDSRRRQLAASRRYAELNGLDLAEPVRDEGVSAYRGDNSEFGALSRFLKDLDSGLIERGSFLIVESLDRLSRQNVWAAFGLLGRILEKGVTVVTLIDGQQYSSASSIENQSQIFMALGSMIRAHDESRTKSMRGREAWANKRKLAAERPLTSIVPRWLRLSSDRKRIEVIEPCAEIVRRIFQEAREAAQRRKCPAVLRKIQDLARVICKEDTGEPCGAWRVPPDGVDGGSKDETSSRRRANPRVLSTGGR